MIEDRESHVGHIAHRVLERPHNGVEHEFELKRGQLDDGFEAERVHRLKQLIETGAMLWIVFEVLIDHVQRALEHGVKDFRHLRRDGAAQLIYNSCHRAQHLGLPCRRHFTALIVEQHGV